MPAADTAESRKTPSFQKVIDDLRAQIREGRLAEHAPLPSERAIAESFGISRMTARRALLAIETEGLAYSSGRRGRFVSPKRLTYDISRTVSYSAHAENDDLGLKIDLISSGLVKADAFLASKLRIKEGDALFRYVRLFLIRDHPAFIEEEYAIARLFPGLLDHDLKQSTTVLMEREYGTLSRSGDIAIRMRALRQDEADLLGLATYHAGIELEQVIFDAAGQPFCYGRQIWRGELAEFTAHADMGDGVGARNGKT